MLGKFSSFNFYFCAMMNKIFISFLVLKNCKCLFSCVASILHYANEKLEKGLTSKVLKHGI